MNPERSPMSIFEIEQALSHVRFLSNMVLAFLSCCILSKEHQWWWWWWGGGGGGAVVVVVVW